MKRKVWNITVKDNPNRVVMGENDEFYTTDTEAYLVFNLDDKNFNPTSAVLTLENRNDGSLKNETVDVVEGLIEWEMPQRYIEHFGNWQGQLVYYDPREGVPEDAPEEDKFETYTSAPFSFVVNAHIGDKKKPSLVEIENWRKFIRDGTELIETWEDMEDLRQANEAQRQANYQELLDTGVLQTNINTKLEALEEEYAPKLTEVTTQLGHKADKSQIGAPTQEQVNTWLDANPQATTTVQDGAITDLKLADGAVVGRHINEEATTATVDHIYTRRHLGFSGSRKKFDFTFPETVISDGTCKIIALLKSNYITGTGQATISPLFTVDGVTTSPTSSSLTISEGVYKQESNYTVPNGTKNLVYSPYPYINLLGQTSIDLEVEIEVYILKNGVKIYPSEVTDTSDPTDIIILDKWRKGKLLNYGNFDSVIEEKKIITPETSNYIEFDDFKIDTLTVEDKNEYFFQVKNHTGPQATLTLPFGSVNIASDSITVTSTLRSANVTGTTNATLGGSLTVDGVAVSPTSFSTTLNDGLYTSVREYPVSPGQHTIRYSLMPYVDFMGQDSITFEGVGTCEITDGENVFQPTTKTSLSDPLETVVYNRFSDNQIVTAGKFKQILTDNSYVIEDQILALQSRWFKKKWIAVGDSITEMYRGTSAGYTTTQYGDNYQGLIGKKI